MLSIRGIRWSAPYAAVFFARAAAAAQERITVPADSSAIHFSEGWHKVALVPRDPLIPLKAPWPPSVIQMANLSSASLSYTFTGMHMRSSLPATEVAYISQDRRYLPYSAP